jgi:hypothetical protein
MTITLELPEELASQLESALPTGERNRFAVSAIADALAARRRRDDERLADTLLAEYDPAMDPEREAAECRAAVEGELADADPIRGAITLDEARRRWEASDATSADRT